MNHAERYIELVAQTRGKTLDTSYYAAFYLLSSEQWIFDAAKHHVSSNGIDFEGLKQCMGSFDEISQNMIEIAYNLFNGQVIVKLRLLQFLEWVIPIWNKFVMLSILHLEK